MKLNLRGGLAALALALLGACGGGTSQIEPFVPTRMMSFGDENSLLTSDGKRYGVNALKADVTPATIDCASNPIWNQVLAIRYGLVFSQCNTSNAAVTATMYAKAGAKVADVKTQIDQMLASSGSVGPKDLITIWAGQNDIVELYRSYPAQSEAQLIAEATARGKLLSSQVNRLANANGRVIILTTFDIGATPYGLAQKAANTDTDRAALLSRLTNAFNAAMRLSLIEDGRLIGLVLADESTAQAVKFPTAFALADVTRAACAVALPDCTTATLVPEVAANTNWMWADDRHLGPAVQNQIGVTAAARAANNPF